MPRGTRLSIFLDKSQGSHDVSHRAGMMCMNRFCIDEEAGFELSGIYRLERIRRFELVTSEEPSPTSLVITNISSYHEHNLSPTSDQEVNETEFVKQLLEKLAEQKKDPIMRQKWDRMRDSLRLRRVSMSQMEMDMKRIILQKRKGKGLSIFNTTISCETTYDFVPFDHHQPSMTSI